MSEKDDYSNMEEDLVEETERNDNEQGVITAAPTSEEGQLSQQQRQQQQQQQQQQAIVDFVEKYALTDNDNDVMRERMISLIQKNVNKGTSLPDLKVSLRTITGSNQSLSGKELDDFARAILNDYEKNDSTIRPVYVDYKITESDLSHDCDLLSFAKHVETLATEYWNNSNSNESPPYVAPYFCFIQSSGMGKTKLLYDYRNKQKNFLANNVESKLILVGNVHTDPMSESIYDAKYAALTPKNADSKRNISDEQLNEEAQKIYNRLDTLVTNDLKWENNTTFYEQNDSTIRPVYVDYKITESDLSHNCDLLSFAKHVETLATEYWNNSNSNESPPYVAPYFCFIQSSGMGKTKLLYEYRKQKKFLAKNVESKLILVGNVHTDPMSESIYDAKYAASTPKNADSKRNISDEQLNEEAQKIYNRLDTLVTNDLKWENNTTFRVLLFDEAQFLLKDEFGMKAFQFRCVRMWLRKVQDYKYVAVFTGTNSGLANFAMETDREIEPPSSSRRMNGDWKLMPKGSILFPHFVMLTTIGCQFQINRTLKSSSDCSEYNNAIIHGRPLFSIMNDHGDLEAKLPNILRRMLLFRGGEKGKVNWEMNLNAWFSILATRVQMGITSIAVASDLVAKGYANLTHVSPGFAHFTYLPDPVCARLAMGMMSDMWELGNIKGRSPSDWVGKLGQIYSSGLCQPEKGDFGEVLAALYFLLCGDVLRHRCDDDLKTFSVDLDLCFALLMNGGNTDATKTAAAKRPRMEQREETVFSHIELHPVLSRLSSFL
ncbi:hypothetical protein IV203_030395 [Nitzschia inconspicua]|uniref:Uncharacterized protein n=1 Tax=Nitzschia inconspicua TaxID=303405 RepID=A0A9K3Q468_9STRA|nr:hypothetical protein IV203_030395 [Nitzschia inconspicua]